jgi:hypothetical protein
MWTKMIMNCVLEWRCIISQKLKLMIFQTLQNMTVQGDMEYMKELINDMSSLPWHFDYSN